MIKEDRRGRLGGEGAEYCKIPKGFLIDCVIYRVPTRLGERSTIFSGWDSRGQLCRLSVDDTEISLGGEREQHMKEGAVRGDD